MPLSGGGGVFTDWPRNPAFHFGASGTLAAAILKGANCDLFCSANMAHPQRLHAEGWGSAPQAFATNRLAALFLKERGFRDDTVVEAMLDPATRIGMSTPGADPSGDYAVMLLDRLAPLAADATTAPAARARILSGGGEDIRVVSLLGRYGGIVVQGHADIMLAYETMCREACARSKRLAYARFPPAFEVQAVYGATAGRDSDETARDLMEFLLSSEGQARLTRFGFGPPPKADKDI